MFNKQSSIDKTPATNASLTGNNTGSNKLKQIFYNFSQKKRSG